MEPANSRSPVKITWRSSPGSAVVAGVDDHALLPGGGRHDVTVRGERPGGEPRDEHDRPLRDTRFCARCLRFEGTGAAPAVANEFPVRRVIGTRRVSGLAR